MNATELRAFVDPTGRCTDPFKYNALAAKFGLEPASIRDYAGVVELTRRGIPGSTLNTDILSLVQGIMPCTVQIFREGGQITGMNGIMPLREAGVRACEEGWFDPAKLDPAMIARPFETPAANYGWGFIGLTKEARRAVVKSAMAIGQALLWDLETYTRPVTADGERVVVDGWGFEFLPGASRLAKSKAIGLLPALIEHPVAA